MSIAILNNSPSWVLPQASIDLDFLNNRYYQQSVGNNMSSLITTSRASSCYSDDNSGNWIFFNSNIPAITNKGLAVWEARTNSIRNNSMQGAVAGIPGTLPTNWVASSLAGLTQTVVGTGTESGVDYIDVRFNGTSSSTQIQIAFDTNAGIAAVQNQVWTNSFFYKLVGGSLTNVTSFQQFVFTYTAAFSFLNAFATTITSPTAAVLGTQRVSGPSTLTDATTAFVRPFLMANVNNTAAVDFTLRIGWPQLELGAFATSPIRTTSAAVVRAADAVTLTYVPPFGSHSLFAKGTSLAPVGNNFNVLLQADQGDNTNRSVLYRNTGDGKGSALVTGGGLNSVAGSVIAANASVRLALAAASSDQAFAQNGSIVTTSAAGTIPTLTVIRIGSDTAAKWNGYVERIAVWPSTRLPNAALIARTT